MEEYGSHDESSPERNLWTAVLMTYFEDLNNIHRLIKSYRHRLEDELTEKDREKYIRLLAFNQKWLNGLRINIKSKWTDHLCNLANVEQSYLLRKFNEQDELLGQQETKWNKLH